MAKKAVLFVVFIMSRFFTIEANKKVTTDEYDWAKPCVPGRFYPGPDCSMCFCNSKRKLICGPPDTRNCKLGIRPPNKAQMDLLLSREELSRLPFLPDIGSECKPGLYYRIDCKRCLCLERKSLACETRLCPSYDTNRHRAIKLTGNPCQDVTDKNCVECSSSVGKSACQAKKNCVPSSNTKEKSAAKKLKQKMCVPGKRYRMKHDCNKCICTKDNVLQCTLKSCLSRGGSSSELEVTEAAVIVEPFDPDFAKLYGAKKCMPGVVYQRECNRCICNENKTLDCTKDICSH